MKLCGNCKHWGTDDERRESQDWRTCQAIDHGNHLGKKPKSDERFDRTDGNAFVEDGSGYFAVLTSRSDFGCVAHEPNEEPAKP